MADPVTPILGLTLPAAHELNWNAPLNENFTLIDIFAGTTVELNPTASQTITQPPGTFTQMNAPFVFGTTPILGFGVTAGTLGGCLTMATAGNFTLDDATPGDGAGTLTLATVNAVTGYQYDGAAPSGHILIGNGTEYVDGTLYYQETAQAGSVLPQESILNFLAPLTAVDDAGTTSTNVSLETSGAAGTYPNPVGVTVDAYGRVTAAANMNAGSVSIGPQSIGQFSNIVLTQTIGTAVVAGQVISFNVSSYPGDNISLFAWAAGTTLTINVSNCAGVGATLNAITLYYKIF